MKIIQTECLKAKNIKQGCSIIWVIKRMNNVIQEVEWYKNYVEIKVIFEDMLERIENGWRVHTCLNKSSDILVVYERNA